jgi:hypothetical protein
MQIKSKTINGRQGWVIDNGMLSLFLMAGGGHIADLRLKGVRGINPFWAPPWKSIEPWNYRPCDAKRYAVKLLACIYGHNLCLSGFGDPSPDEKKCGLGCHYEAPVMRWSVAGRQVSTRGISFKYGCLLPAAQMRIIRTVSTRIDSNIINIRETIQNMARHDVPFTICQHVTFGPPFVEPKVTVFDASATKGHTFPEKFGSPQQLKIDKDFKWPYGPGVDGKKVDLRFMRKGRNSDFYANLMDTKKEQAWFSAANPRLGLLVAYLWHRADYPWLGVWEENHARQQPPWNGKSLTRGMEFANSPFPIGLRNSVDLGKFQGLRTYSWLPARGKIVHNYSILALQINQNCKGVANIRPAKERFEVELLTGSRQTVRTTVS